MDAILEALTKEAGNYGRRTGEGFPRISPEVQAARDAEAAAIRQRELMPNGGGMVPTSAVIQGSAPPQAAPVDPIMASLMAEATSKPAKPTGRLSDQIPGHIPQPEYKEPSLKDRLIGGPEAALSIVTGAPATLAGVWGSLLTNPIVKEDKPEQRFRDIVGALTYQPRTEAGKETLSAFGRVLDASKLGGLGPTEAMAMGGLSAGGKVPKVAGREVPVQGQFASVGAAGMQPKEQVLAMAANASPELKAALEQAAKKAGNKINVEAARRYVDADTLPVPVQITKGQATQDVVTISNERNKRATGSGESARMFNEQNNKMTENVHAIKELAAPDVFATTKPEIGQIPINAYLAKDAELNAGIGAKYKALNDANGGKFPLDVKSFLTATEDALKKELKTRFVPAELRLTLKDIAKNGAMSFEDFEALRTITARIQRSQNADGNAKQAAGIIRNQLENMPLPKGAENLKVLADDARAAAKSRAEFFDPKNAKYDPAFKAIVEGKAVPDNLIQKFVINGNQAGVEKLIANLGGDDVARQAVAAGVIEHLKDAAKVSTGTFSQAGYNKALEKLSPKLGVIFQPEQRLQLEKLGRVARDIQVQPAGHFVNNSNTLVSAIGGRAAGAAEAAVNAALPGAGIGTWAREGMQKRAQQRAIRDMIKPGAGL